MASKLWALAVLVVLVGCSSSDSVDTSLADATTSTSMSPATTTTSTTTTSMPASTTTSTVAPEPPILEITDPQPDEVVATAVYTFQGVTDPGCTVDVGGKYFAEVDADGAWTLDLVLRPGGNATTFTATDGIGQATTARVTVIYEPPITLERGGLGIVDFGDPAEDVMAVLTELLGPPSIDEIPYPGESIFPGSHWRVVRWDRPKLEVHFMDWKPFEVLETPIFGYWGAGKGTPQLTTVEGIGPDTEWVEVIATYGDRVQTAGPDDDECLYTWVFSIDRDIATEYFFHIRGELDGDPSDPATEIRSMRAGVAMEGC